MSEKPILFSAAMVRAILDGRKTQTRRVIKPQPIPFMIGKGEDAEECEVSVLHVEGDPRPRVTLGRVITHQEVRWSVGDRLWVRETWGFNPDHPSVPEFACFRADPGHEHDGIRWRPSIHMPRRVSRITLEVTDVRVQRLQEISYEDALAEGVCDYAKSLPDDRPDETPEACARRLKWPQRAYAALWDHINGAGSWDANPFVVALTFLRLPNAT